MTTTFFLGSTGLRRTVFAIVVGLVILAGADAALDEAARPQDTWDEEAFYVEAWGDLIDAQMGAYTSEATKARLGELTCDLWDASGWDLVVATESIGVEWDAGTINAQDAEAFSRMIGFVSLGPEVCDAIG